MQDPKSHSPADFSSLQLQKEAQATDNVANEREQATILDYDEILQVIGGFGPFQRKVFSLMTIPIALAACSVMSYNFVGSLPDYRCYVPTCDDEIGSQYEALWVNKTAPQDSHGKVGHCERFNINLTAREECYIDEQPWVNRTDVIDCDSWVFDDSVFKSTVATEYVLTCEKEWLHTLVESLFMVGMLIGSFPFGSLADKIGRRLCFFVLVLWMGSFNLACAFAPNYLTFTTLRAFAGATGESMFTVAFVTGVEMIGVKYRTTCGLCFHMCYTFGNMFTGMASYFIRHWRPLQLVLSAPVFLLLVYWWFLPESPRWLISQGRFLEAQKVILDAAKANGKVIPSHMLLSLEDRKDIGQIQRSTEAFGETQAKLDKQAQEKEAGSLILVLRNRILRKRALVIFIAWMVAGLGYFGLSMASTNLSGNLHLNYELTTFIEIPAVIVEILLIDRLGRSLLLSFSFFFCGVCCVVAGVVKGYPVVTIAFSLIGKFFVSMAFGTTYSFSTELFPTAVRSAVMGLCVTFSGVGNILAPVVASLGQREEYLPYLIIGIAALLAGSATIILPETAGQSLPETLQQAEDLEKNGPGFRRLFRRKALIDDLQKNAGSGA